MFVGISHRWTLEFVGGPNLSRRFSGTEIRQQWLSDSSHCRRNPVNPMLESGNSSQIPAALYQISAKLASATEFQRNWLVLPDSGNNHWNFITDDFFAVGNFFVRT
jgi:hypothetical protein